MPRLSVVLPVYCTAEYLRELHQRLVAALQPLADGFELVMVDDGSPDHAWQTLEELATQDARVKAIRLSRNFGQHAAICAGFEHCAGDVIVLMDADLQDRPEDIPRLLDHLKDDTDVVYTVKEGEHEPLLTRFTSSLYHYVFMTLTRTNVPRNIGTFRLFTRRFLNAVLEYPERNVLYGPLMFHVGFQAAIVPVARDPRAGSKSSYTFRKRLLLAINSLLSYTDLPHRLLIRGGLWILALSLIYSVVLVVRYLLASEPCRRG